MEQSYGNEPESVAQLRSPRNTKASVSPFAVYNDELNYPKPQRLFAEPRDQNKLCEEPRRLKFIEPANRIMSPKRKLFENFREETKHAGQCVPQIDLTKAPRRCDDIPQSQRQLFEKPREILKYQEIEGSHPHHSYNSSREPNRNFEDNLLPNKPKLFQVPRSNFEGIEGSRPKRLIDCSIPPRSSEKLVDQAKRELFQKPRDINRLLPNEKRVFKNNENHAYVEPYFPERNLFQKPREVMKYNDVEGSSPRIFFHGVLRPTRQDNMNEILK